ncbi:restriction endonuclease subunit S [Klebsiella sp. Ap-873]|nr:restriction endonuclease subunit S [Klebsiella sp. Ap-873]
MSVEKKVPEIRFKGFSEAWVDSDLKSFSDSFSYGLNASAVKFDGVNKYLRITDIDEKSRRFDYCQLTSPDAELSKSDNYLLSNGDILFARTGASVGKTYIYNEQDGKVYFAGFLIRASINNKASAQFIFQNTQTHEYAKFVAATSQRSGQPGINAKEYGEYRLFSPTEPEQTQIGNYFQKLDALINQHQQKNDKLSSIKKSMLEKMFPKQGEKIPEIRFKRFSGEWVKNNLGELTDIRSAARVHKNQWTEAGVPFFRTSDVVSIYKGYENTKAYISHEVYQELSEKIGKVKKDDLLITGGGSIGVPFLVPNDNPLYFKDADLLWLKNNKKINGYFLYTFFFSALFKQHIKSISHTGTIAHYTIEQAKATPINTCSSEEQTQIGNYFQKLDSLIDQHQQQITKLNNIKQACLSKMFV